VGQKFKYCINFVPEQWNKVEKKSQIGAYLSGIKGPAMQFQLAKSGAEAYSCSFT